MWITRAGVRMLKSEAEIDLLRRVRPHLAEGLRTALLRATPGNAAADQSPGLVLLSDDLALIAATPRYDRPHDSLLPVPPGVTEATWQEIAAADAEWASAGGHP